MKFEIDLEALGEASLAGEPRLGTRVATSYEFKRDRGKAIAVYWPGGVREKHTYFPILHRELPFEIAKLHEGDEKAVLEFVCIWGLLGQEKVYMHDRGQSFLPWTHPDSRSLRDGAKEAIDSARPADVEAEEYESLEWIWGHAYCIEWILSVYESLRIGSQDEVEDAVRRLPRGEASKSRFLKCSIAWSGPLNYEIAVPVDIAAVGKTIRIIINHNLRGVTRFVTDHRKPGGGGVMYWDFRALVQYAYWHLANLFDSPAGNDIEDGTSANAAPVIARCEACNAMFLVEDKRQRFCSKLPGRKQSRCQSRSSKRRQRAGVERPTGDQE
jgi:hypothetical protein